MDKYVVTKDNYEEVLERMLDELNKFLTANEVEGKYGKGIIESIPEFIIELPEDYIGIRAKINFNNRILYYDLSKAFNSRMFDRKLDSDEDTKNIVSEYQDVLIDKVVPAMKEAQEKDPWEEMMKQQIADYEEKRAEERAERYAAKKAKILASLENMKASDITEDEQFFGALGWLAKHVSSIRATVPDFAEDWFVYRFGIYTPKNVVDSTKLTRSGDSMKWHPSFEMSLKNVDRNSIPTMLQATIRPNANVISNTQLIYDLVMNYGFEFGKEQNRERIRNKVPEEYLESFDIGYDS